jgi:hypothetical protein
MVALDLYNLFSGSSEFDMVPKESKNVDFAQDTTPTSTEPHGCSGQGKSEAGVAKTVLLPSKSFHRWTPRIFIHHSHILHLNMIILRLFYDEIQCQNVT